MGVCSCACCASCCALISFFGTILLAILGGCIIGQQYSFQDGVASEALSEGRTQKATGAFIGAGIYAFFFVISIVSIIVTSVRNRK